MLFKPSFQVQIGEHQRATILPCFVAFAAASAWRVFYFIFSAKEERGFILRQGRMRRCSMIKRCALILIVAAST